MGWNERNFGRRNWGSGGRIWPWGNIPERPKVRSNEGRKSRFLLGLLYNRFVYMNAKSQRRPF